MSSGRLQGDQQAMTDIVIDLNADLAEGYGRWILTDDEAMLSVVTSANVACGFHAGDPSIMRKVCDIAAERGVRIGAQVSYRDLAGFGRRAMDVPSDELADEVTYQIGALEVFARAAGSEGGLRQTAWGPLQPGRRRQGTGVRGGCGHAARRPRPAGHVPARLGHASGGPASRT